MAKRGRKPKVATISDLDESLQLQIDEAILSHADESALSIFRRFGLAQRGLNLGTFQKYAGTLRRENAGERMAEALERAATAPPAWEELDRLARVAAVQRLQAGDAKLYEIMLLSRARREEDKLVLEQRAEERAAELHAAKMAELRKAQEQALDETSTAVRLTPEQVREIRLKVLGLA